MTQKTRIKAGLLSNTSEETGTWVVIRVPRVVVVDVQTISVSITDIDEVAVRGASVSYAISSRHRRFVPMREVAPV